MIPAGQKPSSGKSDRSPLADSQPWTVRPAGPNRGVARDRAGPSYGHCTDVGAIPAAPTSLAFSELPENNISSRAASTSASFSSPSLPFWIRNCATLRISSLMKVALALSVFLTVTSPTFSSKGSPQIRTSNRRPLSLGSRNLTTLPSHRSWDDTLIPACAIPGCLVKRIL